MPLFIFCKLIIFLKVIFDYELTTYLKDYNPLNISSQKRRKDNFLARKMAIWPYKLLA